MNARIPVPRFATAGLLCLFAVSAAGADWAQWRGPQRDGHAPAGQPLPAELKAEPTFVWRIAAGPGLSSPVVAGGKVVAFDAQDGRETVRVLEAASGREVWREAVDEPFSDSQGPTGPRCTPMVDDGRVYAVSCKGELQCRQLADGKLVWRANYVKDFGATFTGEKGSTPGAARHGNNGTPVVHGDLLIASVGSTNGAGVVAFDKRTGAVRWKSQNDMAGYAAPFVATVAGVEQVINFTVDGGLGLDVRDGRFLWRFPIKTAFARHVMTPVVLGDLVVLGSHQSGLFGLKITRDGDRQEAQPAWTSKEAAVNFSSPVRVSEQLYGLGPAKEIFCLDLPSGEVKWKQTGVVTTSADKAHASFLVLGERILTLTDTGTLVLFAAKPDGYEESGRQQVCGANWCNPVYADGRLYLRDGKQWVCVELAAR
jgi:outer membrane protein assembly factor BamB